jgi:Putative prokaryotic signal transducing protein
MSEDAQTIMTFNSLPEAEVACSRLAEEGIRAFVSDELAAATFGGMGNLVGGVRLQVPSADAERARGILQADLEEVLARNRAKGIPLTEAGRPAWVCPQCREHVDLDLEQCPSCGALMPDPTAPGGAGPLIAAEEDASFEEDAEELKTRVCDRLAARALVAAAFGIVALPPLLHLYSLWLLGKLARAEGAISAAGRRKAVAAAVIAVLALLVFGPAWLLLLLYEVLALPGPGRGPY